MDSNLQMDTCGQLPILCDPAILEAELGGSWIDRSQYVSVQNLTDYFESDQQVYNDNLAHEVPILNNLAILSEENTNHEQIYDCSVEVPLLNNLDLLTEENTNYGNVVNKLNNYSDKYEMNTVRSYSEDEISNVSCCCACDNEEVEKVDQKGEVNGKEVEKECVEEVDDAIQDGLYQYIENNNSDCTDSKFDNDAIEEKLFLRETEMFETPLCQDKDGETNRKGIEFSSSKESNEQDLDNNLSVKRVKNVYTRKLCGQKQNNFATAVTISKPKEICETEFKVKTNNSEIETEALQQNSIGDEEPIVQFSEICSPDPDNIVNIETSVCFNETSEVECVQLDTIKIDTISHSEATETELGSQHNVKIDKENFVYPRSISNTKTGSIQQSKRRSKKRDVKLNHKISGINKRKQKKYKISKSLVQSTESFVQKLKCIKQKNVNKPSFINSSQKKQRNTVKLNIQSNKIRRKDESSNKSKNNLKSKLLAVNVNTKVKLDKKNVSKPIDNIHIDKMRKKDTKSKRVKKNVKSKSRTVDTRIKFKNKSLNNVTNLTRITYNEENHLFRKDLSCLLCNFKTDKKDMFMSHLHGHIRYRYIKHVYACEHCRYVTNAKCNISRHVTVHNDEDTSSSNSSSKMWAAFLHKFVKYKYVETIFACDYCMYVTNKKNTLIKHIKTHTGEKPYSCNICNYNSIEKTQLINHMRIHNGQSPYNCNICDFKSMSIYSIRAHIRHHNTKKSYICEYCKYKCRLRGDLIRHIRTHTNERPYACSECDSKFKQKNGLVMHMKRHTGEKSFKCNACTYKSTCKSTLLRHTKKHDRDKYSCKLCIYKCSRKKTYRNHMKIHEVANFVCALCKCGFRCAKDMRSHVQLHKKYPMRFVDFNVRVTRSRKSKKILN